jgi:hypothetical protein
MLQVEKVFFQGALLAGQPLVSTGKEEKPQAVVAENDRVRDL